MIYLRLFWEFFKVGLFSVGGGLATLPFLYSLGAKTGWFSTADVANMLAVSESTPGPIGVNMATYAGFDCGGVLGGAAQRAQVAARHAERQRRIVDPPDVPEFDAPRGAEVQHPLGVRALCAHAYTAAQQLDGFFQHSSLISHIPRRRSCRRCAPRCRSCCAASNSARARAG